MPMVLAASANLEARRRPVLLRVLPQEGSAQTAQMGLPMMTGAELRAHRKAAGLTQLALAQRAKVSRDAVQYWEAKASVNLCGWAPKRICEALGLKAYPHQYARARGWGLSRCSEMQARMDAQVAVQITLWREREAQRAARRRVICGARTRKGTPCRNKSEPGKKRCKFHGGKSTGPRTAEGKARIAEAQRRRWHKHSPTSKC
jgi:DNA-binding XRE family transcriptional regulator